MACTPKTQIIPTLDMQSQILDGHPSKFCYQLGAAKEKTPDETPAPKLLCLESKGDSRNIEVCAVDIVASSYYRPPTAFGSQAKKQVSL